MTAPDVIDAHVHVWDPRRFRIPWLRAFPALDRPHLPEALDAAQEAAPSFNVVGRLIVHAGVDPADALAELEWLSTCAESPYSGVIAWAPLDSPTGFAAYFSRMRQHARVRAVRWLIQFEPHPERCLGDPFTRALEVLASHGYPFEICVRADQLALARRLVERSPRTLFVLDHAGKPRLDGGDLAGWRDEIRRLAAAPNTVCKLSGLTTSLAGRAWDARTLAPVVDHLLQTFTPARLLYGSDWPVCTSTVTLHRLSEVIGRLLDGLSASERTAVLFDNAVRCYRLEG